MQVLDGDGLEYTRESEADTALMRSLAAQSIVLLKNDNALLPLKAEVSDLCLSEFYSSSSRPFYRS